MKNHINRVAHIDQCLEPQSHLYKSNSVQTQIEKSKSKDSSKRVHLRKDIINKAIIRAFIKFYNKLFKCRFLYHGKSKDYLYNKLHSIINKVLKSSESYKVLLSLVNSRNLKSKSVNFILSNFYASNPYFKHFS